MLSCVQASIAYVVSCVSSSASIQFLCCNPSHKIHSFMCVCVCARVCVYLCMCRQGRKHCVLLIKAPPSLMSPRKRDTIGTCRLATLHSIFGPQSRQTHVRAHMHAVFQLSQRWVVSHFFAQSFTMQSPPMCSTLEEYTHT